MPANQTKKLKLFWAEITLIKISCVVYSSEFCHRGNSFQAIKWRIFINSTILLKLSHKTSPYIPKIQCKHQRTLQFCCYLCSITSDICCLVTSSLILKFKVDIDDWAKKEKRSHKVYFCKSKAHYFLFEANWSYVYYICICHIWDIRSWKCMTLTLTFRTAKVVC